MMVRLEDYKLGKMADNPEFLADGNLSKFVE
jgi:hypothetical protein